MFLDYFLIIPAYFGELQGIAAMRSSPLETHMKRFETTSREHIVTIIKYFFVNRLLTLKNLQRTIYTIQ